jgi:hypothetical protein
MLDLLLRFILPAAYQLLPPAMESQAATALLLSIAMQESGLEYRRQIGGPARGWFQFERSGVRGVLDHPSTAAPIAIVLRALRYDATMPSSDVLAAIEHNDVLAAAFARCLLWTDSRPLPFMTEPDVGWQVYVSAWRPGRPRPETWQEHYAAAWARTIVPVPGSRA